MIQNYFNKSCVNNIINKIEKISGKIVDNRKNSFPGEVISDFLQDNKNLEINFKPSVFDPLWMIFHMMISLN